MMNLHEGYLSQSMRAALNSENYFNSGRQPSSFIPSSGFDMANTQKGDTTYATGVPHKERHRQFFGMGGGNRPYTIR